MEARRVGEAATEGTEVSGERTRLVRLCARFTGDREVAEDLAQETIVAAWHHVHTLRHPELRQAWLAGIARHMCLQWARRRGRDLTQRMQSGLAGESSLWDRTNTVADDFDLDIELERAELAALLDRALALLPPLTRRALVEKYIHEAPQAEIAARLGLSEGAVEARLSRGKLALRRVLTTDLRQDAATYGLVATDRDTWQQTRLWCAECGQHRLVGRFTDGHTALTLRCPACFSAYGVDACQSGGRELFAGITGFKAAFTRIATSASAYYRRALLTRTAPCLGCNRALPLHDGAYADGPFRDLSGVHYHCGVCGVHSNQTVLGLALALPEGRRFYREHPRIHVLPERTVEAEGRVALVTTFASVTGTAQYTVVSDRASFAVLSVHGAPEV